MTPQIIYMTAITTFASMIIWLALAIYFEWEKTQKILGYLLLVCCIGIFLFAFIGGWVLALKGLSN